MNENEFDNDLPVDDTDIQGRLVEPEKDSVKNSVLNRNLQLSNLNGRELWKMQQLEVHNQTVGQIPNSMGGNIFRKWGAAASTEKNHYLLLSGSKGGFIRKMLRTNLLSKSINTPKSSAFERMFSKKKSSEY